ncbi:hypothetical protein B0T21DRAFT_43024 [Apiosordaria backusii]|uniref:Uncharacterized protein n=1 Tax=Apiosordaria backusii TaxID=314023 RepID=A0AA40E4K0_9PEZI|nr:hypothetical protein B0T21DRAFT_43024 [Apiosordaria backusii]
MTNTVLVAAVHRHSSLLGPRQVPSFLLVTICSCGWKTIRYERYLFPIESDQQPSYHQPLSHGVILFTPEPLLHTLFSPTRLNAGEFHQYERSGSCCNEATLHTVPSRLERPCGSASKADAQRFSTIKWYSSTRYIHIIPERLRTRLKTSCRAVCGRILRKKSWVRRTSLNESGWNSHSQSGLGVRELAVLQVANGSRVQRGCLQADIA